ncbi:MAG TPA: hypothetical protein VKR32_11290 [Puia sp.]|nr:hypothetical protein [Puia sp.]
MKTTTKIIFALVFAACVAACSRAVTPYEAANHHFSHCRDVK